MHFVAAPKSYQYQQQQLRKKNSFNFTILKSITTKPATTTDNNNMVRALLKAAITAKTKTRQKGMTMLPFFCLFSNFFYIFFFIINIYVTFFREFLLKHTATPANNIEQRYFNKFSFFIFLAFRPLSFIL